MSTIFSQHRPTHVPALAPAHVAYHQPYAPQYDFSVSNTTSTNSNLTTQFRLQEIQAPLQRQQQQQQQQLQQLQQTATSTSGATAAAGGPGLKGVYNYSVAYLDDFQVNLQSFDHPQTWNVMCLSHHSPSYMIEHIIPRNPSNYYPLMYHNNYYYYVQDHPYLSQVTSGDNRLTQRSTTGTGGNGTFENMNTSPDWYKVLIGIPSDGWGSSTPAIPGKSFLSPWPGALHKHERTIFMELGFRFSKDRLSLYDFITQLQQSKIDGNNSLEFSYETGDLEAYMRTIDPTHKHKWIMPNCIWLADLHSTLPFFMKMQLYSRGKPSSLAPTPHIPWLQIRGPSLRTNTSELPNPRPYVIRPNSTGLTFETVLFHSDTTLIEHPEFVRWINQDRDVVFYKLQTECLDRNNVNMYRIKMPAHAEEKSSQQAENVIQYIVWDEYHRLIELSKLFNKQPPILDEIGTVRNFIIDITVMDHVINEKFTNFDKYRHCMNIQDKLALRLTPELVEGPDILNEMLKDPNAKTTYLDFSVTLMVQCETILADRL